LLTIIAWCVGLVLTATSAQSQDRVTIEKARELIEALMVETHAPGVAVSIGIKGEIVWSEGFGYADVEQESPVTSANTKFRIGSVSKPMTAVAIGRLYEEGKLDLDAPVQTYVPSFPVKRQGVITTRLLAGHLAGIRHYKNDEFLSTRHYPTVSEGLDIFKDDPLLHAPGSAYSYSSYGWNLISVVVENVADQEFLSYMDEYVFKPAGMTNTVADFVTPIIPNRTGYYESTSSGIQNTPYVDNSYKWAGGGFLSTSDDLIRFGFAHLNSDYLNPETVEILWTPQTTTAGDDTGYGIGWTYRMDGFGRFFAGHNGGSVGGTTTFAIYPDDQLVVAVIANMSNARLGPIAAQLADLFYSCCVE